MILKRKMFGLFSAIRDIRKGIRKQNEDIKEREKLKKTFTPEMKSTIERALPRDYQKLLEFGKLYNQAHDNLGYTEFGLLISWPSDIWSWDLDYDINKLGTTDTVEIVKTWNNEASLYCNLKTKKYETDNNRILSWPQAKQYIIDMISWDAEWMEEEDMQDEI